MAQVINTNVSALNAQRSLQKSQSAMQTSLQRLSSGLRINSAKDDAAGLAISDRFMAQINGLGQASRNANDGISLAQTAEGSLDETTNALQRMRTLAVQAANDTNSSSDREAIQIEVEQLVSEINRIGSTTQFNGKNLLDGSNGAFTFQIGANAGQSLSVNMQDMRASALGTQPGQVQTVSHRIALSGDSVSSGYVGIAELSTDAGESTIVSVDGVSGGMLVLDIEASSQNVNIAEARYGGNITQYASGDLADTTSINYGQGAAKQIAERINSIRQLNETDSSGNVVLAGVYATATTEFSISDISATSGADVATAMGSSGLVDSDYRGVGQGNLQNGQLKVNGVDIGPVTFQTGDADGSLVNAINAKSSLTGVSASINSKGELQFNAADGRDIILQTVDDSTDRGGTTVDGGVTANLLFAGGGSTQTGQDSGYDFDEDLELRITGQVTYSASSSISVDSTTVSGEYAGLNTDFTSSSGTAVQQNVKAVGTIANADVTTVEGANTLIKSVDSALKQVDSFRATLGATQNRFEMTIRNLDNVSENLSAANSRIKDADFAAETTNMTRAQILQQAGISMLSQANAQTQNVMSLLR